MCLLLRLIDRQNVKELRVSKRRFKGLAYPIIKHPHGFFRNADSDLDEIKSSMAIIVLTEPKERIFEPHFGCNLRKINLNAPKEMVESEFRVAIATSLKRWEKRVQVEDVKVGLETVDGNLIATITIYFLDPVDVRNLQELTIYKSLGGINGRRMPF